MADLRIMLYPCELRGVLDVLTNEQFVDLSLLLTFDQLERIHLALLPERQILLHPVLQSPQQVTLRQLIDHGQFRELRDSVHDEFLRRENSTAIKWTMLRYIQTLFALCRYNWAIRLKLLLTNLFSLLLVIVGFGIHLNTDFQKLGIDRRIRDALYFVPTPMVYLFIITGFQLLWPTRDYVYWKSYLLAVLLSLVTMTGAAAVTTEFLFMFSIASFGSTVLNVFAMFVIFGAIIVNVNYMVNDYIDVEKDPIYLDIRSQITSGFKRNIRISRKNLDSISTAVGNSATDSPSLPEPAVNLPVEPDAPSLTDSAQSLSVAGLSPEEIEMIPLAIPRAQSQNPPVDQSHDESAV